MINLRKTVRAPFDQVIVRHQEIEIVQDGAHFLITEEMIDQHLKEGWHDNETVIHEVDGIAIELANEHYRSMKQQLHPFGR